ncbi:MAG: NUDIX hydrolase [Alphaproteobacteria bacterium]
MTFSARAKTFIASLVMRQRVLNRWAHRSLPRKRLAACVLLFDDDDRLLVLRTTYRTGWLVPGGTVDPDESPWEGARREAKEEIGLDLGEIRFAGMDWRSADAEYDDSLHFVFDGGVLSPEQRAAIRPDGIEIADYRFADRAEARELLEPHLCLRIMPCWDQRDAGRPLILNRGEPDRQAS